MALSAVLLVLLVLGVSLWRLLGRGKHAVDQLLGPPTVPIFGNALSLAKHRDLAFATMNEFAKSYFPLYRTWLINVPVIHPLDPKYVEAVLTSSQHITKSEEYQLTHKWLGTGLLTSGGSKWHTRRKMLTPAFHFKILEQFLSVFNDKSTILISKLRAYQGKAEGFDIVPYITHCALDVICETAMGTAINAQENSDSKYVSAMYEVNELIVHRMLRPWLFPNWIFDLTPSGRRHNKLVDFLHTVTDKVIKERREERRVERSEKKESTSKENDDELQFGTKKKTAFLDLLLSVSDQDRSLDDADIREEVDTFMFEGHDTTAMAMSWATHFLGSNPDVQAKCVSELSEIFGGSDRAPTMADLGSMKYLERVIKETLRLRPSVFLIGRKLNHTLKLDDVEIPANTRINIHIYSIHRNPHFYPDPEKFDPERFSPENSVGRHPYVFIPFSAGPRNCIGQKFAMLEMKSLLSRVLRNFRLESIDPEHHYQASPDLILRPKFGLQMKLFPRKMP